MTDSLALEKRPARWARALIIAVAGILTVAAMANAIVYLIALVSWDPGAPVWIMLIVSVVFPLIAFLVALIIGLRRPLLELALVLLAGVGLAMVFWMNVLLYALVPIFSTQ
ncbi:hypothetical protein [uncultured Microbacterium sp.]|uniref:hypothetical protein n=1 Tax=uncultured Microbacterium sp. TaxID=191216 RepID=UPI0026190604|nr:hypothetical protein [uncultured Microbacterium sp.]